MDRLTDRTIGIPSDFVRRKRHGRFISYVAAYCVGLGIVLTAAFFHEALGGPTVLALTILIFGGLTLVSLLGMQRLLDLVLSVEFQNAIFSSTITRKFDFTMIIDHEGAIAYYDQGFRNYFPEIPSAGRAIDQLLNRAGIIGEKEREILAAIYAGNTGDFLMDVPLDENRTRRFHITFAPVIRPVGFYVIQGRAHVDRKDARENAPSVDNDIMPLMHGALLHSISDGAYAADAHGLMLYANPSLVEWLGYSDIDLSGRQISLNDLLYQPDGARLDIASGNYEGDVLLRRNNGSLVRAYLRQQKLVPPSGETLGIIGIVKRKDLFK
ncbi:MAG: PAS domain-containing protein [Rickettsiales bacterium]